MRTGRWWYQVQDHILDQGFSASHHWPFGLDNSFFARSVRCIVGYLFSSILEIYSLDASSTSTQTIGTIKKIGIAKCSLLGEGGEGIALSEGPE